MGIPGAHAPARLGRYELLARLAAGGMGEIFLARLEGAAGFEKLFVVKRILPHLADDTRFRSMLIGEARIASKLSHANICQVYELGETDGQLYIVMEYLEGITLLPLLRRQSKESGMLDLGFIGGVIQQVTDALHYAHELRDRGGEYLGIVHRDVTPSNVFLTDSGVAKVLDFGIAKVKDASTQTQTGTVKGKYAYMAPEQLRGTTVDRRADVFALGVVVYEMLALRRLFQRKTDYLTFRAVMEQPIPDVRRYRPDCPDPLAIALSHALDREPENRFESARQFGTAILDAISAFKRPWTQGDIGDFVRTNFAAELSRRSEQIASAVRSGVGRATMPLILQSDDHTRLDDDDSNEFPAVDSATAETPYDARSSRSSQPPPLELTPPPFAADSHTSGANLAALRANSPSFSTAEPSASVQKSVVAMQPRRSLLWPMVAVSMVAVSGGALFLVWKQMQTQPPPSTVVISGEGGSRVTGSGNSVVVTPGSAAAVTPPSPPPPPNPKPQPTKGKPKSSLDPYKEVVRAKQVDATRCTTEHGAPPPGTRVVIIVGVDGHPKSVTIDPASVDTTPLGACIKNVFKVATFPPGPVDKALEVKLVHPA